MPAAEKADNLGLHVHAQQLEVFTDRRAISNFT